MRSDVDAAVYIATGHTTSATLIEPFHTARGATASLRSPNQEKRRHPLFRSGRRDSNAKPRTPEPDTRYGRDSKLENHCPHKRADGAVEKKQQFRHSTVDFIEFFRPPMRGFVAGFVAMVKQARRIELLRQ